MADGRCTGGCEIHRLGAALSDPWSSPLESAKIQQPNDASSLPAVLVGLSLATQ